MRLPCFKNPRAELFCNQKKRSVAPRAVTKKAPRLSPTPVWIRQWGSEFFTVPGTVAVGPQDNIYIAGNIYSSTSIATDAFFAKYSPQGKLLWIEEFAPIASKNDDYASGIAVDSRGSVFITGPTVFESVIDPFPRISYIVKYSSKKKLLWKKVFDFPSGADINQSNDIAIGDRGNVVLAGGTYGQLGDQSYGNSDAWLAKYSSQGKLLWKKQLGTNAEDFASGITVDSRGNIFVTGSTEGQLGNQSYGRYDAFVVKYSSQGKLLWKKQLGTNAEDFASDITVDSRGNIFVTGSTEGQLGNQSYGRYDAFVVKYSSQGKLLSEIQLGTNAADFASGITVDSRGNVLVTGSTEGQLGDQRYGDEDAWLAKYRL
jgi:hypothetical protein